MPKGQYRIQSFWNVWHVHCDLCKHLGIDYSHYETSQDRRS